MTLTTDVDLRKIIREPSDTYHAKAKENLSSHALGDFRRCAARPTTKASLSLRGMRPSCFLR